MKKFLILMLLSYASLSLASAASSSSDVVLARECTQFFDNQGNRYFFRKPSVLKDYIEWKSVGGKFRVITEGNDNHRTVEVVTQPTVTIKVFIDNQEITDTTFSTVTKALVRLNQS